MKEKISIFFLALIFLVAFILRFYKLGEIPYGFYQDESAIGYNAYSIIETGRDEHGKFLPLYFKSFGDYKLPVYIYTTIITIKLFGLNEFAIRFPSAFFGFLTVIVFHFFVKEISQNRVLSIVATFLLAINPWHLHYSRATFEVSVSLFLFTTGSLLVQKAANRKSSGNFFIGTICFILSLYSYNLTRLLAPALYAIIIFVNRQRFKQTRKEEIFLTVIVSIFLLFPFFRTLFEYGGLSSASGTLIFSSAQVQAPLLELRSYFVSLPELFTKMFFNQWALTKWQYFNNVVSYFSIPFYFVSGSSHGNHGIGNVGQLYLFEFPLVLIGVYTAVRERLRSYVLFFLWGAATILVASLTREVPHATRSFFLITPLEVFSALGFIVVWNWIRGLRNNVYRIVCYLVAGGFIFYNLVFYFSSYYIRFPIVYAKAWRSADKAVSSYIAKNQDKYNTIIFDKEAGFIYTSLLFYLPYSPFDFQSTAMREADDLEGFSRVVSFGKFEFRDIDWKKDYETGNTLIVTTPTRKPNEVSSLKTFYYPRRPVVVSRKQEILQYPVEEVAYVLIESKR